MSWKDLSNDGVRLAASGDVAGARTALEAAVAQAPPAHRAQALLNLAHVVDLAGDRQHAVDLMTEALPVAKGPVRALLIASRADLLPWLGRWDEAWQDVTDALTVFADQVPLLHSQVGLLMMAGRLAEAEAAAVAAIPLAARHAPQYVANFYACLAQLAEAAGDEQRAAQYRLLAGTPAGQPLGPQWQRFTELNAEGAARAAEGDRAGAEAAFLAAHRETGGKDDVDALVCRAAVAGNLAGVAEDALRWSTEAVELARSVLAAEGDVYGVAGVLVNALMSRASAYLARGRLPEALAELDEALTVPLDSVAESNVRAGRARVLAIGGWFTEAAAEARRALDLAYAVQPALAAQVHSTLSEIASATGDLAGATEHLALARDLYAATGDVAGEATAVLSLARLAYLAADADQADRLYDEAERLVVDDPYRQAVCLLGRAAVSVLRGRPRVDLVNQAAVLLGPSAGPLEVVSVNQIRGSTYEAAGEYAAAEACYAEAEARCAAAGLWHVALGMAWWRADALVRRAAAVTGAERHAIAAQALDLALPAALAAEAVRQRFPHGPLRERWVALAAAPATRSAFLAIRAVEDTALAAEYIDHIAGAVSLDASGVVVAAREDLVSLPVPASLPLAAAGFGAGAEFAAEEFELPPRVRFDPTVPSTMDAWIDVTEARYGFPVRSRRAVAAW